MRIEEIKISELKNSNRYDLEEIASKMILHLRYCVLNFCGCGCPDEISFMIRDVLKAINDKTNNYDKMDYDEVINQYNKELVSVIGIDRNNLIYEFILNVLDSVGLIEHGSSIHGAWLTDYGKEILCAFEIVGDYILDVDYFDYE